MFSVVDRIRERVAENSGRDGTRRHGGAGTSRGGALQNARYSDGNVFDVGVRGRTARGYRSDDRAREAQRSGRIFDDGVLSDQGNSVLQARGGVARAIETVGDFVGQGTGIARATVIGILCERGPAAAAGGATGAVEAKRVARCARRR